MEFASIGIVSVGAITVICYVVAEAVKAAGFHERWCPVLCGVVGGVIGAIGMRIMPDFPAHDIITAIAVGIVSGLAATGCHQIGKQLSKGDNE